MSHLMPLRRYSCKCGWTGTRVKRTTTAKRASRRRTLVTVLAFLSSAGLTIWLTFALHE